MTMGDVALLNDSADPMPTGYLGESVDGTDRRGVGDLFFFLRAWADKPGQVAAIAPSGRPLAAMMTREIAGETGPVLELGPGTGVFTRALLARGVRERDLTLIECRRDFALMLHRRFPEARILCVDAARLVQAKLLEAGQSGAAVSGLPLRRMPPEKVVAILSGAFASMRPGGSFYQFTYRPGCPIPRRLLDRLGIEATRIGTVLRNIPPAAVYRLRMREPSGTA
jgi:phospholipid N-methyltransferase